ADTAANGGTDGDFITKSASQTISGTLSANLATGETVQVSLDGGTTWTAATAAAGQNSWSLSGQTLTGSNTLQVKVADNVGNDGSVYSQAYVLDTTAPTTSIATATFSADSGTGGDWITKSASQTISGTLSASLAAGETVYVSLDGGTTWKTATTGQNSWSLADQTLTGSNTLQVKVTDAAGNDGSVYSQAYVLDTTAPTASIATAAFSADSGTGGDFITSTANQTISGTLSTSLAAGETVQVSLDGGTTWKAATVTAGQNSWSLSGQTLTGSNTLQVKVTDLAGNEGSVYSQAYVLDTTAPTVTIGAISTDDKLDETEIGSALTISGTASGAEDGQTVTVGLNGQTYTGTVVSGAWSVTVGKDVLGALINQPYTVTADVSDRAGNAASQATRGL
ncbi:Ig-like domain-containing protein, partial [Niveispirillum sp. SYP-B3756]|uniref:Ig-like domain-containing protein n=1 Tax=Niveispirillum sp. SYP-B3756 TaxID=2662178 RepID=UPI0015662B13